MLDRIEGTVAKVYGEEWVIVAQLDNGFCLAVRNGNPIPASVYLIYCCEIVANFKVSEVTL